MSGPLVWWANRKSKHGMQVSARKPPSLPGGKEWWTEPPTAMPQPEHIEYVVQFANEVQMRPQTPQRDTLLRFLSSWLKAARRLLHEEWHAPGRDDLSTTDGILIAAGRAIGRLVAIVEDLGGEVPPDIQETREAIRGRGDRIRRERAAGRARR